MLSVAEEPEPAVSFSPPMQKIDPVAVTHDWLSV
jgi:hypothetical protein